MDEAASMNVLCVDKTGTLTSSELAVAAVAPMTGHTESEVLMWARMASSDGRAGPGGCRRARRRRPLSIPSHADAGSIRSLRSGGKDGRGERHGRAGRQTPRGEGRVRIRHGCGQELRRGDRKGPGAGREGLSRPRGRGRRIRCHRRRGAPGYERSTASGGGTVSPS